MKLAYTFEYVDLGEEIISVPIGPGMAQVQGVLKLNKEGKEIVDLLSDEISEQEIIDALCEKYETDKKKITLYVNKVVSALKELGLIK